MANNVPLYYRCGEYYGKFVNQVTGEICDMNDEMMDPNCLYVQTKALTNFSMCVYSYILTFLHHKLICDSSVSELLLYIIEYL